MRRNPCVLLLSAISTFALSPPLVADPLPGRDVLKFVQRPMLNTPIPLGGPAVEFFHGHDELSTAYSVLNPTGVVIGYQGEFMADDFADRFNSPVVHVKWWGSYLNRPTSVPDPTVKRFLISFETDIPADVGGGFSRPGTPLLNQVVDLDSDGVLTPGSGTFTETITWPTSVDGPIYEYNAELHLGKEFFQKADTVYWLKVVALVDAFPNTPPEQLVRWGWHNRDYTIMEPLASVAPAVVPGEHVQGLLPDGGGGIPIWHFQDDSVSGFVNIRMDPANPMSRIMPIVEQDVVGPENYQAPADGPSLIQQYSKDLAFALYTIPEPSSCLLIAIAWAGLCGYCRRRAV